MIKKDVLKVGLQVVYDNGHKKEYGFVTSWDDKVVYCRFFYSNPIRHTLRTVTNSEGCRYRDIRQEEWVYQTNIDEAIDHMRSKPEHFGWHEQGETE